MPGNAQIYGNLSKKTLINLMKITDKPEWKVSALVFIGDPGLVNDINVAIRG